MNASGDEAEGVVLRLASGGTVREGFTAWLKARLHPLQPT
jgi:hypothetical protein